jgi:hypothetical protein
MEPEASSSGHKAGPSFNLTRRTNTMTRALTTAAIILLLAPCAALAQNRPGDAALGALSGAVVLGPVGAVAGAVIGYSAGPAIARSWGFDRPGSARHRRQASKESVRGGRAEVTGDQPAKNARVAASRTEANGAVPGAKPPAPSAKAPPVQTLE